MARKKSSDSESKKSTNKKVISKIEELKINETESELLEENSTLLEALPESSKVEIINETESEHLTESSKIEITKEEELLNEFKLENIYANNDEIINIKKTNKDLNLNNLINETYAKSLINKNISIDCIKEFILNDEQVNNLLNNKLTDNKLTDNYTLDDLKKIFNQLNEAIIIIEVLDGNIKFIEKKGNESRNQSVIDLIMKANNYKKLPDVQFIIFTNDFINIKDKNILDKPYLFTFCKKYNYNTSLFPNFNFNHWIESNIPLYEDVYNLFINNNISWNDKKDTIFWSGANTNIIRKKISESSKLYPNFNINLLDKNKSNFIPINETIKYKYLLNMNGYSYGGRLNYLFITGSCVIILKNNNKEEEYEEYFYKYFIPNEDYIEIKYNNNEDGSIIINRIITEINKNDCEKIAKNCFEKAKLIFNMNSIYENIHKSLSEISNSNFIKNKLNNTICYTPPLNYFFKDRINNNFNFMGKDLEINLFDNENNINIKIINDKTKIKLNKIVIFDQFTPHILNNLKPQHYQLLIEDNILMIIIDKKFSLIKVQLTNEKFNIKNTEILTESGGWWFI